MGALNQWIEENFSTATTQAITELNVFDLRRVVARLIEHSDFAQIARAYCADARPEASCFAAALLVHVVMKKIPVLRLRADCNRGGAGYATGANRSLTMTPAATTKMGCPAGSKGTEFVRQLAEVSGYDFVDGDLVLTLKSNAGAMRFTPAAK